MISTLIAGAPNEVSSLLFFLNFLKVQGKGCVEIPYYLGQLMVGGFLLL